MGGLDPTMDVKFDTGTISINFDNVDSNAVFDIESSVILSNLTFYTTEYGSMLTTEEVDEYATELVDELGDINSGVPCGWHYNEETGEAAGYFSEILNDPDWQAENPELYTTLSQYVCPSYLPFCTGQRTSGIVAGNCVSFGG